MRILIVGCGVIGHLYARGLSARGHDVTLLGRDPVALERLARDGVEFVELRGQRREHLHFRYACGEPGRGHDLIVVAIRNDHLTERVLAQIAGWVDESALLLLFHLGFSGPRLLPTVLPSQRVLVGYAISTGGFWSTPGRTVCFDVPPGKNTAVGSLGAGSSDRAKDVARVLGECGFACQLARMPENVYQTSALIAAFAAFDRAHPALLDGRASAEHRALLGAAIGDALRVADRMCDRPRRLSAHDLGLVGAQQALEFSRLDAVSRTLLMRYFRGGGRSEVDKLYGELVTAAEELKVEAPALSRLAA